MALHHFHCRNAMTMMSSRQEPSVKAVMLSPGEHSMLKNDQVEVLHFCLPGTGTTK
jgi:hypothetical protein